MKKKHILFLVLILIIIILLFFNINTYSKKKNQTIEQTTDYFTTSIEDIDLLVNDKIYGYVYFGRDTCNNCLYFNTFLEREYLNNKYLKIYKFDTDYWRNNEYYEYILEKYNISTIPTLINIFEDKSYDTMILSEKTEKELQLDINLFLNKLN